MKEVTHSSPLNSKKFIAAMAWNIGWLILITLGIVYDETDSVLLSMIWVSGATQVTYLGGQAALDAFVRRSFLSSSKITQSILPTQERTPEFQSPNTDEESL